MRIFVKRNGTFHKFFFLYIYKRKMIRIFFKKIKYILVEPPSPKETGM